ncbi:hypothetical protein QWT69_13935 [Sporosarcina oncorhynchi]|uniref:Uncharacterized protein n=1 Tax=Sporosarcina oncorhynchi TaxID=3056444 RepID=A0ABZ0L6G7_9BACL|nr:hypothetical protein [Sporosarcina sp. T2O-4]WOV86959.1 hypothetical protein QWT69_13935 [Sporosarcina sp. T2O-4]
MSKDRKEDIQGAGKGLVLDTILNVGSETAAEIAKESFTSLISGILVDTTSSLIPGVAGAVHGYKRVRFERNITAFTEQVFSNIDVILVNLESKTREQKEQIDQLFNIVLDYVIDEQQEDKIQYMVNGFLNLTDHEQVSDDFVLTYYDVLKELRMVDISVLSLMFNSRYVLGNHSTESFRDVMERHGLSYEQYQSVRGNLKRIGLLVTKTDLNVTDDLEEIVKRFKELYDYLDKVTDPKYKRTLPKLKLPKLKSKENLELSKFGSEFVRFFINIEEESV